MLCFPSKILWHLTNKMKALDPSECFHPLDLQSSQILGLARRRAVMSPTLAPPLQHWVWSVPQICWSSKSHDNFKACVCSKSLPLVSYLMFYCFPFLLLLVCRCRSAAALGVGRTGSCPGRQAAGGCKTSFFYKVWTSMRQKHVHE